MAGKHQEFGVRPAGEMRAKYGLTAENRPVIRLDPRNVPEGLRCLIPLAEKFGIGDDLIREDFLAKTPTTELREMKKAVQEHEDLLEEWLTGPSSTAPELSDEYVALTCLLMSAYAI